MEEEEWEKEGTESSRASSPSTRDQSGYRTTHTHEHQYLNFTQMNKAQHHFLISPKMQQTAFR